MRRTIVGAQALGWLLLAAPAWGDAVDGPPLDCLLGTEPSVSHAGPYCAVKQCEQDASCAQGATCRERGFCIQEVHGGSMNGPETRENVVGLCEDAQGCSGGECVTYTACGPPEDDGAADRIAAPPGGSPATMGGSLAAMGGSGGTTTGAANPVGATAGSPSGGSVSMPGLVPVGAGSSDGCSCRTGTRRPGQDAFWFVLAGALGVLAVRRTK